MDQIFTTFLFKPLVDELDECTDGGALPVLESSTRKELYDLVLALCEDSDSYLRLLELTGQCHMDSMFLWRCFKFKFSNCL